MRRWLLALCLVLSAGCATGGGTGDMYPTQTLRVVNNSIDVYTVRYNGFRVASMVMSRTEQCVEVPFSQALGSTTLTLDPVGGDPFQSWEFFPHTSDGWEIQLHNGSRQMRGEFVTAAPMCEVEE